MRARVRSKDNDMTKAILNYMKLHQHSQKQTWKMILRHQALLRKMCGEIYYENISLLTDEQQDVLQTITNVYYQQKNHILSGDSLESILDKTVSISKSYIRPIMSGKDFRSVDRVRSIVQ